MSKRDSITLFLFIDAFGWEVLRRNPHFLQGIVHEPRPLETVFGYSSACDPSIISGCLPQEHGYWSSFFYAPDSCPYPWIRHLSWLPSLLTDYHKVRNRLSRWIAQQYEFTGYFQLYNMPFDRLAYFDYAEKYRIWEPGGMPKVENLFDRLASHGIPYFIDDSPLSDGEKIDRAESIIRRQDTQVLYLLMGQLDGLMHRVGPLDPKVDELINWYDQKLRHLIQVAEENAEDVRWIVFSDHGMHRVTGGYDLKADVESLGLKFGRDYAAVFDSTMARFWFLNDRARELIHSKLNEVQMGRFVSQDDLARWGCAFPDHKYGESIFLMNSGTMIAPCDMGRKAIPGMHGFHPNDADSRAMVLSPTALPDELKRIEQLFPLMCQLSGLPEASQQPRVLAPV